MLSIIILQYNNYLYTHKVVESIKRSCKLPYEIIVVDNASTNEESRKDTAKIEGITFVQNFVNSGFGGGNNLGAKRAKGDILLFLNNDTLVLSDIVTPALQYFVNNLHVGIIGPKIYNEDGTYQLSCGKQPSLIQEFKDKLLYKYARKSAAAKNNLEYSYEQTIKQEWVSGAALFIRKELFFMLNGFDEKFFMYFEDKDLCMRALKKGWEIHYFPKITITHMLGGSVTKNNKSILASIYRQSQMYYYQKHRNIFEQFIIKLYHSILQLLA